MDLHIEDFQVADLIDEVLATVRPLVAANGNSLNLEIAADLGAIQADRVKVKQNLYILLSNATKFTRDAQIWLEVANENEDWIEFRVRDQGIGIAPEHLDSVFDPFIQADLSTTRKFGGTGLGLTITRRFCEMMGGEVTVVESEPGKGSTFSMRLPRNASPSPIQRDP